MNDSYQPIYDAVRSRIGGGNVSEAVTEAVRQAFDISYIVPVVAQDISMAAEYVRRAGEDMQRPSVLMRPSLSINGNQWCALYGQNLQDGVAGFGDSPEKAMRDFDVQWNNALARQSTYPSTASQS